MIDLTSSTVQLIGLVGAVEDGQLGDPTPCPDFTVAALLDHIAGFCLAFTGGALKQPPSEGGGGPSADAEGLMADWREVIPERLTRLADVWGAHDAWDGMTVVAGVDLPGEQAGLFALDEIVLHSWDLARATGQSFAMSAEDAGALEGLLVPLTAPEMAEVRNGLFGPIVEEAREGSRADQVLALAGRDPGWQG